MERSRALWLALAVMVGAFWFLGLTLTVGTPPVAPLLVLNPGTTAYMKRDPNPIVMHKWVSLSQISPALQRAVIAREDDAFYTHPGYDLKAMEKAAEYNWRKRRFARGGSTITMQVARNLYLSPQKSLLRKARELLISLKLERILSKDRILEIYLNVAEWGNGVYGAEAAAQHYFHKGAANLGPGEAKTLAAILPRPKYYDRRRTGAVAPSPWAGCDLLQDPTLPLRKTKRSKAR